MNEKIVSREQIKYFAILLMLIDHIILIFPVFSGFIFELVDGLCHFTFITMIYLLVEGFFFTSSRKKYAKRLLVFALVSQIPYCFAFTINGKYIMTGLNVIFNLLISFIMLWLLESDIKTIIKITGVIFGLIISLFCDSSVLMSGSALLLYYLRKKNKDLSIVFIINCIFLSLQAYANGGGVISCIASSWGIIVSAIFLLGLYSGKTSGGRFNKWLFYVFYPAHLLILGIMQRLLVLGII